MSAMMPLAVTTPRPLSALDYLQPGARPLPKEAFAAQMRPFLSPEVVGPHGQHALRSADTSIAPLNAFDSMPGVHLKHGVQPPAPLTPADFVPGSRPPAKDGDVETQARKWVSQTFFGTLLKQMHESPFKSELFSGGRGGKAFEPLMDQHLAEHIARGAGKKLVGAIARQLKGKAAKAYGEKWKPAAEPTQYDDMNGGNPKGGSPAGEQSGRPPRETAPNPYPNVRGHVPTGVRG